MMLSCHQFDAAQWEVARIARFSGKTGMIPNRIRNPLTARIAVILGKIQICCN
jgi:hypothetical protein